MKNIALGALALFLASLAICAAVLTGHAVKLLDDTSAAESQLAASVPNQIDQLKSEVLAAVNQHATRIEYLADSHLWKIEKLTTGQLTAANASLSRVSDAAATALPGLATAVSKSVSGLETDVHGVTDRLAPVLDHAASVTEHADEASAILFRRDALPAQILGTLGAAKVTLGETAQTMRTIRDATPGFVEDGHAITGHVKGISGDLHREVDKLTAPEPWWRHVLDYAEVAAVTAARIF